MSWLARDGDDLILTLHLQPRAARDEVVGPHGAALKVRITAPPVEGRANAHLCRFLAGEFGVAAGHVTILSGEGHRAKRVRIHAPRRMPGWLPRPA